MATRGSGSRHPEYRRAYFASNPVRNPLCTFCHASFPIASTHNTDYHASFPHWHLQRVWSNMKSRTCSRSSITSGCGCAGTTRNFFECVRSLQNAKLRSRLSKTRRAETLPIPVCVLLTEPQDSTERGGEPQGKRTESEGGEEEDSTTAEEAARSQRCWLKVILL